MDHRLLTFATLAAVALGTASVGARADEVYGGLGFPGLTLGYAHSLTDYVGLRGEFSGGLRLKRNVSRDGINYDGDLKAQSLGAFVDWFPSSSAFRLTGGVTFNRTNVNLHATGSGIATINDIPVSLVGKTYDVDAKFPRTTPYFGLGYGFKPKRGVGWGFYADAGVMVGKFDMTTSSAGIVGLPGTNGTTITQADLDAQSQKLRDKLNRVSVLPKLSLGVAYSF